MSGYKNIYEYLVLILIFFTQNVTLFTVLFIFGKLFFFDSVQVQYVNFMNRQQT